MLLNLDWQSSCSTPTWKPENRCVCLQLIQTKGLLAFAPCSLVRGLCNTSSTRLIKDTITPALSAVCRHFQTRSGLNFVSSADSKNLSESIDSFTVEREASLSILESISYRLFRRAHVSQRYKSARQSEGYIYGLDGDTYGVSLCNWLITHELQVTWFRWTFPEACSRLSNCSRMRETGRFREQSPLRSRIDFDCTLMHYSPLWDVITQQKGLSGVPKQTS